MRQIPAQVARSAVTLAASLSSRALHATVRAAGLAMPIADGAARNAADATETIHRAARQRDEAYRDAEVLIREQQRHRR